MKSSFLLSFLFSAAFMSLVLPTYSLSPVESEVSSETNAFDYNSIIHTEDQSGVAGDSNVSNNSNVASQTCNNPIAVGFNAKIFQTCCAGVQNQSFFDETKTVDNTIACVQTSLGPASTITRYLPVVTPEVELRVTTVRGEEGVAAEAAVASSETVVVTITRTLTDRLEICRPTYVVVSSILTETATVTQTSDKISTVTATIPAQVVVTGVQDVIATVYVQEFFTKTVEITSVAMVQQDIISTSTVTNKVTTTQTSYVTVSYRISPDENVTVTNTVTNRITRVVTPSDSPVEGDVLGDSATSPTTPCEDNEPAVVSEDNTIVDHPVAQPDAAATSPCDVEEPVVASDENTPADHPAAATSPCDAEEPTMASDDSMYHVLPKVANSSDSTLPELAMDYSANLVNAPSY